MYGITFNSSTANTMLYLLERTEHKLGPVMQQISNVARLVLPALPYLAIGLGCAWALNRMVTYFKGNDTSKMPANISKEPIAPIDPQILFSNHAKKYLSNVAGREKLSAKTRTNLSENPSPKDIAFQKIIYIHSIAKPEEQEHINPTLNESNKSPEETLISFLERAQNLKFDDSIENAEKITLEMISRMKSLYFHGTHFSNLQSIKERGLTLENLEDKPEIHRIHRIAMDVLGEKENTVGLLGWLSLQFKSNRNAEKKNCIYVASNPLYAKYYAEISPEWFWLFITGTYQPDKKIRDSYFNRDKDTAKSYLEERLTQWQATITYPQIRLMTQSEADEIRLFFEQYWEKYKEYRPVVLKVKYDEMIDPRKELELSLRCQGVEKDKNLLTVDSYKEVIHSLYFERLHQNNIKLDVNIPPSQIAPIYIP